MGKVLQKGNGDDSSMEARLQSDLSCRWSVMFPVVRKAEYHRKRVRDDLNLKLLKQSSRISRTCPFSLSILPGGRIETVGRERGTERRDVVSR